MAQVTFSSAERSVRGVATRSTASADAEEAPPRPLAFLTGFVLFGEALALGADD